MLPRACPAFGCAAAETPLLRRPVDDMDCLLDTYDPTNPATHVEVLPEQRPHPDIEHLDRGLRRTHDACAVFMFIPNGIDVTPGCSKGVDDIYGHSTSV